MYLMIQNSGVADVRSFTKLGLSSARGQSDKIGQFGSGAKHGVLTLMRHGLNPAIYCGRTKLEFFSQPAKMGGTSYGDMFVRIDKSKAQELSFCLEFGSLDWTDVAMGLRELVSNAIDNDDKNSVEIAIVEKPRAKDGFTRVFVPVTPDVQQFVNTLPDRFLQFSGREKKTILEKEREGRARIYRKGVFIRELSSKGDSLFDYNFGDELTIDECRNSSDWDCQSAIASAVSKDRNAVNTIFSHIVAGKTHFAEFKLSQYSLECQSWWLEIWENIAGKNAVIITETSRIMVQFIVKAGFKPYVVTDEWHYAMKRAKIRDGITCLDGAASKGCETVDVPVKSQAMFDQTWQWLAELKMTGGKNKPKLSVFAKVADQSETTLCGYYENGCVYINVDNATNRMTYLEEFAHYVTNATDCSRAFQEYFIQATSRMLSLIFE